MIITCTHCQKKLTVRDENAGKKVRCPGCKGLIAVPTPSGETTEIVAPLKPKKRTEAHAEDTVVDPAWATKAKASKSSEAIEDDAAPKKKSAKGKTRDDEEDDEDDFAEPSGLRCARCDSAAIRKLPPNAFTRHPGFVCTKCSAVMRPPGSTTVYMFALLMGVALFLFGLTLFIALIVGMVEGQNIKGRAYSGAVILAVLGLSTLSWGCFKFACRRRGMRRRSAGCCGLALRSSSCFSAR